MLKRTNAPLAASLLASAAFLMPSCATHESVGRPPSAAEVAHINGLAAESGSMRIEYVKPFPPCGDGGCVLPVSPVRIEYADNQQVAFLTSYGSVESVPTPVVTGVSAPDGVGAVVGGLVGAAIGFALSFLAVSALEDFGRRSTEEDANKGCDPICPALMVTTTIGAGVIGIALGKHQSRRTFDFDRPASALR